MSKVPFILSGKSVSFTGKDGSLKQVSRDSVNFTDVINELRKGELADLEVLAELAKPIVKVEREIRAAFENAPITRNYLHKRTVVVMRDGVFLDGVQMHGVLVDRMLEMVALDLPLGGMIRFMENLYMNPSETARDELYLWLEGGDLPITDDGHFLAYKYVNQNYRDCYSGKFDNSPGKIVQLAGRHEVDPIRDNLCSHGLHFCSKSYLGSYSHGKFIVLVKINPADVVSIPSDYNNAKGRTWRYEVLRDVTADYQTKVWAPLTASDGTDYSEFDEDGQLHYSLDSGQVTIETDEDGDFYVYVTNGYDDDDAYVQGTLVDAKRKARELADELEIEDDDPEEDDADEYHSVSGTTAEGYTSRIEGPDEDGEYYWSVKVGPSPWDEYDGYAVSAQDAQDYVNEASREAAEEAASKAPLIKEADPELEALLAEEEEIQSNRVADAVVRSGFFTFPIR